MMYVKLCVLSESEEKVMCQAVLFSTDLRYNPVRTDMQDHFTYYSAMLIRGPVQLSETIQNWIEVSKLMLGVIDMIGTVKLQIIKPYVVYYTVIISESNSGRKQLECLAKYYP